VAPLQTSLRAFQPSRASVGRRHWVCTAQGPPLVFASGAALGARGRQVAIWLPLCRPLPCPPAPLPRAYPPPAFRSPRACCPTSGKHQLPPPRVCLRTAGSALHCRLAPSRLAWAFRRAFQTAPPRRRSTAWAGSGRQPQERSRWGSAAVRSPPHTWEKVHSRRSSYSTRVDSCCLPLVASSVVSPSNHRRRRRPSCRHFPVVGNSLMVSAQGVTTGSRTSRHLRTLQVPFCGVVTAPRSASDTRMEA